MKNLLISWQEFLRGKRKRKDVAEFSLHLMSNIIELHQALTDKTYIHGGYEQFKINDPKPRDIHKASVRDRLLHHAIYRILYTYFDRKFVCDSFSCRINKGTHEAINRFRKFAYKVSKNDTRTCWILKCDIRKFFASIDHEILKNILTKYIGEDDVLWLLGQIIDSFNEKGRVGVGLPLGNLTSQLLVNIYMNEFDQFIKRELKIKYYIRYADDFVLLSKNKLAPECLLLKIEKFLRDKLKLELHLDKVHIKTLNTGIDFLGYVTFPKYRLLRTKTRKRIFRKLKSRVSEYKTGLIDKYSLNQSLNSYLGVLSHANSHKARKKLYQEFQKQNIFLDNQEKI